MKLQYFGDINDYVKYGLLRCFAETGIRVGLCWMLTPNDDRSDGGKIEYLRQSEWEGHDPKLYRLLSRSIEAPDGRQLRHVERSGLIPNAVYFDAEVPDDLDRRIGWYKKGLATLKNTDLLFFDPDNGIEVNSKPRGRKDSSKYVYWDELEQAWGQVSSLVVFQHFPRKKRDEYISEITNEMRQRLRGSVVVPLRSANVLFLLAYRQSDAVRIRESVRSIARSWSPRVMEYSEIWQGGEVRLALRNKGKDMTASYSDKLKLHLSEYKRRCWPSFEDGIRTQSGKQYAHILPKVNERLNVLEPYGEAFWKYFDALKTIKLHRDFHHLTSSQAMCINLLYPFMSNEYALMPTLLSMLDMPATDVHAEFEKVLLPGEDTNFDFMIASKGNPLAFFELKLSESGLGRATRDKDQTQDQFRAKYEMKLRKYHLETLGKLVDANWLQFETFVTNYQLLRNVSYLGRYPASRLFFIYPRANKSLEKDDEAIRRIADRGLSNRITIHYLEDVVERLLGPGIALAPNARRDFEQFKEKYIV